MPMQVPLTRVLTGEAENAAIANVVRSGWLTQGKMVADFERAVGAYLGVGHAIAASNCTTALHLALLIEAIAPGDEVIVPSYTWIATANVIAMVGAVPVFADIDPETFNITAETIAPVITRRTRAVMPVHQFGMPADMAKIEALAADRRLGIIEDAACALGSTYRSRPVGNRGHMACFSFHPRKPITTGEGGMLVTDADRQAERARVLLNHGASVSDAVKHRANTVGRLLSETFIETGYNYRMTDLQGAVGVAQMARLDTIIEKRRLRAGIYHEALSGIGGLIPPRVPEHAAPNWQSYAVRVSPRAGASRNAVAQKLLDAGVACRPAYMACHLQPVYRKRYPGLRLRHTENALETVIILPLYPQMTDAEQQYVIETLKKAVA